MPLTCSTERDFASCRCADLPYVFRSNRNFCHLLVIIPGPTEPANVEPYVEELFQDFKQHGPSGDSLMLATERDVITQEIVHVDVALAHACRRCPCIALQDLGNA